MLKQALQQTLHQKLSPKQVQVIRMLQMPALQLEQHIEKELEENPVLEEVKEADDKTEDNRNLSIEEYVETQGSSSRPYTSQSMVSNMLDFPTLSVKESLYEQLQQQLGFAHLDDRQNTLASFLIQSLDNDGYLRRDLSSLVDDIAFRWNTSTDENELNNLLKIIQGFEPSGVGARDLQECLLIQLKHKTQSPEVKTAINILERHFNDFTGKLYDKVRTRMHINEAEFNAAVEEIVRLNPKPGGVIDTLDDRTMYVVPDFLLEVRNGAFNLTMPRYTIPNLRISQRYEQLLKKEEQSKTKADRNTLVFLRQKIESAKWFIDALKQRQDTLMKTMQSIIDYQHDFFMEGDESLLRPMALKHIAFVTSLDISTVSRVVTSKYIQTHFGIFALKSFFSEGTVSETGEEVSIRNIKKLLMQFIEEEDKKRPYSDEELAEMMQKEGFTFARRTIAKYREQLNIPTSRMRKRMTTRPDAKSE
ncbi:MAG: RNA polymerase factor sigma-54 [Prevotellaceae bacterium]|jgi:RNA polymerase sigma-54 factor|nr:RNA polymerase factor sigma-54 [Prevotellaceae bacterium]